MLFLVMHVPQDEKALARNRGHNALAVFMTHQLLAGRAKNVRVIPPVGDLDVCVTGLCIEKRVAYEAMRLVAQLRQCIRYIFYQVRWLVELS